MFDGDFLYKNVKDAIINERLKLNPPKTRKQIKKNWKFTADEIRQLKCNNWVSEVQLRSNFKCFLNCTYDKVQTLKKVLIDYIPYILDKELILNDIALSKMRYKLYNTKEQNTKNNTNVMNDLIIIGDFRGKNKWEVTITDIIDFIKICMKKWWEDKHPQEKINTDFSGMKVHGSGGNTTTIKNPLFKVDEEDDEEDDEEEESEEDDDEDDEGEGRRILKLKEGEDAKFDEDV